MVIKQKKGQNYKSRLPNTHSGYKLVKGVYDISLFAWTKSIKLALLYNNIGEVNIED
jgi:hypothetical protein